MPITKYTGLLRRIDFLIRTKAAGNIKTLSQKLGRSRSTTLLDLKEMKELGFPIAFCRKRKCYYYTEEGKMTDKLFNNELSKEEAKKIFGGKRFFQIFSESGNIRLWDYNFTE